MPSKGFESGASPGPFELQIAKGSLVNDYRRCMKEVLHIEFPEEYLARGHVFVKLDRHDQIIGGFTVVETPPFRSLQGIPPEARESVEQSIQDVTSIAEVNGVWLANEGLNPYKPFQFWVALLKTLAAMPQRHFVFAYDQTNRHSVQVTKWIRPKILFSGLTQQLPGMAKAANEEVVLIDSALVKSVLKIVTLSRSDKLTNSESLLRSRLLQRDNRQKPLS